MVAEIKYFDRETFCENRFRRLELESDFSN